MVQVGKVQDKIPWRQWRILFQKATGLSLAVGTCPERMDAADAEWPRPPRIETAVEF